MYPSIEAPSSGIFVKRISDQLSSCPDIIVDTWTLPHWNKYLAYLYFYFAFIFKILVSRPNYTYCHFVTHTGLLGVFAKKIIGSTLVLNCHGSDVIGSLEKSRFRYKLCNFLFRKSDLIITPSRFLQDTIEGNFIIDSKEFYISPSGGVPIPQLPNYKDAETVLNIGYVGRIVENKGVNVLVQALNKITIPVHLTVAGAGDPHIFSNIKKDNTIVKIYGELHHEELHSIYSQIDVLIFPTLLRESLGLTPLEAMAFGVPVIGSDIGAIPEYIIPEQTGYLVHTGCADSLRDALLKFSALSKSEKMKLSAGARKMAQKYDEKIVAMQLIEKLISL